MPIITVLAPSNWKEYSLLDSGEGERLERFGAYITRRPDPQALWKRSKSESVWDAADAWFVKNAADEDKGSWKFAASELKPWSVKYNDLEFQAEPTPFKHVGIFPEQAVHWDWMRDLISKHTTPDRKVSVLNLFGYTGLASVACAKEGAFVTHVDASRPSITRANENAKLSGIADDSIRWILEDVLSFVKREARRGNRYDAIIMDPPAFGHGAKGEVWKFHTHFPELLTVCREILSDNALFMVVNAYAVSVSALFLYSMLDDHFNFGTVTCGELALAQEESDRVLSTGIFGRWQK
jgi:23S rRNA (cytosine1962-C5)-methyltransferase